MQIVSRKAVEAGSERGSEFECLVHRRELE